MLFGLHAKQNEDQMTEAKDKSHNKIRDLNRKNSSQLLYRRKWRSIAKSKKSAKELNRPKIFPFKGQIHNSIILLYLEKS